MIDKLKILLKITDELQDPTLHYLIDSAKAIIEQKLWYSFDVQSYTENIDVDGSSMIFLSRPIVSIDSIQWWELKKFTKNVLYLKHKVKWEITINYQWWLWDTLPSGISQAIINLAKWIYENEVDGSGNIKSKKIDTLSISYFSANEKSEWSSIAAVMNIDSLIAPYKLLYMAAI